ncbi:leucine zipper transcription factor-like protein 1 isoform X1 [Dermochelys coriacea]|uniref:leucine zipper transcription factor-like protein 1 isoform X1 n=2 Tax=Dermochelys coriacea TaxID=27794 RepID=UPI0018E75BAE|nr:leucine zipper transcription factor-like protein 1 isoform X1 [Dermochelys coriacea]
MCRGRGRSASSSRLRRPWKPPQPVQYRPKNPRDAENNPFGCRAPLLPVTGTESSNEIVVKTLRGFVLHGNRRCIISRRLPVSVRVAMAELGLNDHHQNEVINYMRFARSKRGLRLKTVDSCFQDLKDSRLVEETFTVDEVTEMLDGLQTVVHSEVESELINTAYTNVLLLRQLFSQAEKWYLKLQTDISELENRELLEQVAEFEKAEFTSSNKKPSSELIKPKLAPLNEGGSELLNKEITRLQEENEKLKTRLKTIETQATSALDEKSKLEKSLKDLQMIQGDQKTNVTQDISELEDTVSALRCQFEKTLNDSNANQKFLEENLVTTKHDLLKVQDQLSTAEKELEKKFQQTAAFRNMKEILTKKNEQIKDLRRRLSRYEPDD